MAGKGPPPSDPATRRRRNKPETATNTISPGGPMRGKALPAGVLPQGEKWHPRTVAWWATWRKSPQSKIFLDTDWDFLLDTALMHHVMWSKGRWEFAAEIRLRVAGFGATAADRQRLKMQIEMPDSKPAAAVASSGASVTDISSRRKRLLA